MPFDAAGAYRRNAARGLTPTGIVVQAYDQIINSLNRAIRAMEARNIEQKTDHLNHALTLIAYLQAGLDFEQGGEVAKAIERFYNVERTEILKASLEYSTEILRGAVERFISMREAWQKVDSDTRAQTAPSGPASSSALYASPRPEATGDSWSPGWSA